MEAKTFLFALNIIISNVLGGQVADYNCPEHWLDGSHVDMGCLLINRTEPMTWEEANKYCQSVEDAALVEIHIPKQLEYLSMELKTIEEYIGPAYYWTGGTDKGREGN